MRVRQGAQVLVLFALILPLLLGALGLAVEAAYALAQRQRMQAAADLGAVNGVYCLAYPNAPMCSAASGFTGAGGSQARGMALSIAQANGFDSSHVAVTAPYQSDPNRLAVDITQTVTTPLLGIIGFPRFSLSVHSAASLQSSAVAASVLALNPTLCSAVNVSGNGSITINLGSLQVDSNCATALTASGNATVTAPASTVGGYSSSGSAVFSPTPTTGAASMADPLAALATPNGSGLTNYGAFSCSGGTATLSPGIYTSISISSNCNATMQSGTYVLAGGGLSVGGGGSLSGTGVLLYNAGSNFPSTGGTFGGISLGGTGSVNLTPQTSGIYKGLVIFQARDNPQSLSITGNAIAGVQGTVYASQGAVSISGNGTLPAQFIVNSLSVTGNGNLTIQYSSTQVYGTTTTALVE